MTNKYLFRLLVVVVSSHLTLGTSAIADSVDVFPLQVGLRSVYRYQQQFTGWGIYSSSSDSGTVQLMLVDSSMANDTTVVWSFRECRELVHWQRRSNGPDTTYAIVDSAMRDIYESTRGLHELRSSSAFWSFPVSIPGGPSHSVFRYADSIFSLTSIRMSNCPTFAIPSRYDSLWLSSDSGLYRRQWARCEDNDWYGWASWNTMRLVSQTIVSVEQSSSLPLTLRLFQSYPNPFNPTATITYDLPNRQEALVGVYDLLGRQVAVVSKGVQEPGRHQHTFDGSRLVSGVYFIRLQTLGAVCTNKIILLK